MLALDIEVSEKVVEKAVVLTLADETKFDLSQVLKVQGISGKISGKSAELVKLFTEADELEAVSQGQAWAEANASYLSSFSKLPHFPTDLGYGPSLTSRHSPIHPRIHCPKTPIDCPRYPLQPEHIKANFVL